MHNPDLERLLRAAAQHEKPAAEMPYGFDARIVALARAERTAETTGSWEIARLLRRVAVGALVVTAFASSAAYWEFSENDSDGEPLSNAYAMADTAIEAEFLP